MKDTLYQLSVQDLRQSPYFSEMLDDLQVGHENEGKSDDHPILLDNITESEMDSFLVALRARYVSASADRS